MTLRVNVPFQWRVDVPVSTIDMAIAAIAAEPHQGVQIPKNRCLLRTFFLILSTLSISSAYPIAVTQNPPTHYNGTAQPRELVHSPDGDQEVLHNNNIILTTQQQKWSPPSRESDVLAWTEMNCTSEEFRPSSNYRGLECHLANLWPEHNCPIVGLNVPACSRCTMWRRGQLPLAASPGPSQYSRNARPQPCDETIWEFGYWNGEEWLPSGTYPQCSNLTLSPADVYQCLKGRRVVLFGDSMIRPLLGRLAAYLRGMPQYVDHVYHFPGGYYMANGTHDAFVEKAILPSLRASAKAKSPRQRTQDEVSPPQEASWDPRVTLEMQFYWASQFTNYTLLGFNAPPMEELPGVLDGSDVMIAGPMYHSPGDYEPFRMHLIQFFQKLARVGKRVSQFFWIGSIPDTAENVHEYGERNHLMRAFITMLNGQSMNGDLSVPRRSYYVNMPRMAHHAPTKRIDRYHYQCTMQQRFPAALNPKLSELPESMDCRAILHLNLIQSILKVACDQSRQS
ncbi:hypothetical protein Vafri_14070 [Volvox africanus]|uniref:SGNH domain-containing protein n=1 Tax=Volvox africanus TaxID=51714 RepID=A0A8J4F370_9CHLO|nr:hypothetical protein Vafri_14070 [Volvox africanus]